MFISIKEYSDIVGEEKINELIEASLPLKGKRILMINSTRVGGGVAELLSSYVPLFNELDIKVTWAVMSGNEVFFRITKKIHNALQGGDEKIEDWEWDYYLTMNEVFAKSFSEEEYDMIVVHDPQPMPLILYHSHSIPWILRIHIDLSSPSVEVWNKVLPLVKEYDRIILSSKDYVPSSIKDAVIIPPAIDPLKPKNIFLPREKCEEMLSKFNIDVHRPIMAQVSRYDKWKDPLGVIEVFEMVKKEKEKLQLVLLGNEAHDDPEGSEVFKEVVKRAEESAFKDDIFILSVNDEMLVNALQRRADVVIQKSIKEGFGLVVSEAMYKYKAVVASNVGGIKLQVNDGINGFLLDPYDYKGFADKVAFLLDNDEVRAKMGVAANATAREKFLIIRLIRDWIELMKEML